MQSELEKLIVDLISFKTQNQDYKEIQRCVNYICEYFYGTDYICEINETNKVKSIFIHKSNSGDMDCLFNGHIDVVTADSNQFTAQINNGKLFGRGAIDMKSQVATFIYFLKHYNGNKNLGALITSDEEIGGFNGTPQTLQNFKIKTKLAIVPDGGYNFQLVNSEWGVLQLDIEVLGKSAHSSKEPEGINALCRAMDVYYHIKDYLNSITPGCQTVNLAKLTTDNNVYNKVPDKAKMLIDIRYNAKTDIDYVYNYLDGCSFLKYSVYAKANPFYIDINNPILQKYIKVSEEVLNRDIEVIECQSASDARFFSERDMPVIMMNPDGENMHAENEALKISSIDKLLNIYTKFVDVL